MALCAHPFGAIAQSAVPEAIAQGAVAKPIAIRQHSRTIREPFIFVESPERKIS